MIDKKLVTIGVLIALLGGCATGSECCTPHHLINYADSGSGCTHAVQRIIQANPCAACEQFPVTARLSSECIPQGEIR